LRLYNFQETETQIKQRKEFKLDFTIPMREEVEKLEKDKSMTYDREQKEREKEAPAEEEEIVDAFLKNFVFDTNNKRQDQINLNLCLKAIPARVDEHNFKRMPLFAFQIIQNSLIAYQNED